MLTSTKVAESGMEMTRKKRHGTVFGNASMVRLSDQREPRISKKKYPNPIYLVFRQGHFPLEY